MAVGQRIRIALVRTGKEDHQAVGYLPDGTMIVVNHAVAKIGTHRGSDRGEHAANRRAA